MDLESCSNYPECTHPFFVFLIIHGSFLCSACLKIQRSSLFKLKIDSPFQFTVFKQKRTERSPKNLLTDCAFLWEAIILSLEFLVYCLFFSPTILFVVQCFCKCHKIVLANCHNLKNIYYLR